MSIVGDVLVAVFLVLGGLHFYWGLGGLWPARDQQSLRALVVGGRGARMPGFWLSAAVALALACAALLVAVRHGALLASIPGRIVAAGYAVLILVFGGRGVAPYVTGIFDYARDTPFFDMNRRYYSPLCMLIAAALGADFPEAT